MSVPVATNLAPPAKRRRAWFLLLLAVPAGALTLGYWLYPLSARQRNLRTQQAVKQADTLRSQGRPQQAIAELRRALDLTPSYTQALTKLLDLLFSQGRNEEAAQAIWDSFRYIHSPENRIRLLVFLWTVDSDTRTPELLDRSIAELQRAVEVEPVYENQLALAINYMMRGNTEDLANARAMLENLLRQRPDNLEARRWLFTNLMRHGESELAALLLEGLPASVAEHPEVLLMRAQVAMVLDRPEDAIEPYQKRLQRRPLDKEAHHQLAAIFRQLSRPAESEQHEQAHAKVTKYEQEAETLLEDLYSDRPTPQWTAHCVRMGFITEEMGYWREAEGWYAASYARRPDAQTLRALRRVQVRQR